MLTDPQIEKLKAYGKTKRVSIGNNLDLHLRKSGNKIFLFRYQWDKRPQTITIGRHPSTSVLEACQVALSYRILLDKGIDPRATLEKNKKEMTFRDIGEKWFSKNSNNWRDKTRTKHRNSIERDLYPIIGHLPINEITKAHLLQVLYPHDERGHTEITHRLYYRLKCIFELANAAGLTENFPFNGLKKALTPKAKTKSNVAIHPSKAHEMLANIRKGKANKIVKLYIELLALLLVRPSELRLSMWQEFDFQHREWNIPASRMKLNEPHWVPLPDKAIDILKELRLITGFTPYVFNTPNKKIHKPISETSARTLLHRAGYKGIHSLHGFRSLSCTVINSETHFKADAVEAQQARKVQGVRSVYMRADFKQERRELMVWYSSWISNNIPNVVTNLAGEEHV